MFYVTEYCPGGEHGIAGKGNFFEEAIQNAAKELGRDLRSARTVASDLGIGHPDFGYDAIAQAAKDGDFEVVYTYDDNQKGVNVLHHGGFLIEKLGSDEEWSRHYQPGLWDQEG